MVTMYVQWLSSSYTIRCQIYVNVQQRPISAIEIEATGVMLGWHCLLPIVSPADGRLTTLLWQGCQVCVKISTQLPSKASPI